MSQTNHLPIVNNSLSGFGQQIWRMKKRHSSGASFPNGGFSSTQRPIAATAMWTSSVLNGPNIKANIERRTICTVAADN